MNTICKFLLAVFALALPVQAQLAGPPALVDYQGQLLNSLGGPITGAGGPGTTGTAENFEIRFRVWDAQTGGSLIWAEKQIVTVTDQGVFVVRLGEGEVITDAAADPSPLTGSVANGAGALRDVFDGSDRFLGVTVMNPPATPGEIQPRLAFLTSPFAFVAAKAQYADQGPSGGVFSADSIGVNTSTPNAALHVDGRTIIDDATLGAPSDGTDGGDGTRLVLLPGTSSTTPYAFGVENSALWYGSQGAHKWYTSTTLQMILDGSGQLGVGTATPAADVHISRAGSAQLMIEGDSGNSDEGAHPTLRFQQDGGVTWTEMGYFAGTNNFGIEIGGARAMTVTDATAPLVGFGTEAPDQELHVEADVPTLKLENAGGSVSVQRDASGDASLINSTANSLSLGTAGRDDLTIDDSGEVGIGTTAPGADLHISNVGSAKLIIEGDSDDSGEGDHPTLRFQQDGGVTFTELGFFDSGNDFGVEVGGTRAMTITNAASPRVGIGTASPFAPLHVNGSRTRTEFLEAELGKDGVSNLFVNSLQSYGVYVGTKVLAQSFLVRSDERMKKLIGRSDSAADLKTLQQIEITDYRHIDQVTHGAGEMKKVIAQQVEKVFPQAVRQSTEVIPDIYQSAPVRSGWVELETDLAVGERVRLVGSSSESSYEVVELREGAFRCENMPDGDDEVVFVYGREVDDFRAVDYEALAMLNVSATQELHQRLQAQESELAAKVVTISALESRIAELEKRDAGRAALFERVAKMMEEQPAVKPVSHELSAR